jgi:Transposase DDE domain
MGAMVAQAGEALDDERDPPQGPQVAVEPARQDALQRGTLDRPTRWPAGLVAGQPGLVERACQTGGELTGPNPTDRGKPGSKYHLLVDRGGIPMAVGLSAANTHDSVLLEQMVDAVAPVKGPRGRPGRPRKRPAKLHLDKGYDYPRCRRAPRRHPVGVQAAGLLAHLPQVAEQPEAGTRPEGQASCWARS